MDNVSSNGLNDRVNQTLVNRIRCKIYEYDKKVAWSTVARRCTNEYNNTVHSVTKYTPNYLISRVLPNLIYRIFWNTRLSKWQKKTYENTLKIHEANKKRYDPKRKEISFDVDDKVYIENGCKLDELRIGPFLIVKRISNTLFEVNVGHKKPDHRLYHASKIIKKWRIMSQNYSDFCIIENCCYSAI